MTPSRLPASSDTRRWGLVQRIAFCQATPSLVFALMPCCEEHEVSPSRHGQDNQETPMQTGRGHLFAADEQLVRRNCLAHLVRDDKICDFSPMCPRCWPTPSTISETYQWAFHMLAACVRLLGADTVRKRLMAVPRNGLVTTHFSGVECAMHAWRMISQAAAETLSVDCRMSLGPAVERDHACQRVLLANFPGRCLFGDVLAWIRSQSGGRTVLRSEAACLCHGGQCSIGRPGQVWMDVSGPPCILWSTCGAKKGGFVSLCLCLCRLQHVPYQGLERRRVSATAASTSATKFT